ncbi:NmrA/HSCARG family protein [Nocardia sp. NPDC004604]|uniref:NmrA/HSCARG family protein n=1 Tax=Nocardia sp. NPDC004604 TaxID=3157013 RepID=UPI0033BEE2C4
MERELIVVTGATGRQGGAVVRHLLARGMPIRALTRNPDSPRARSLAASGVELCQGDMDDVESLERAMIRAHGVYSVQDFWSVGAEREVQQGRNVADAARAAGVEHLVFSSVGGAERGSRIDHFETKGVIERHIRALGLPATILRPASFMENYYIPAVEKGLLKGRLNDPLRADIPYQTIATDDIGKFVALAFARPDEFLGVELEIAGSELTNRQAAEVFARVLGRSVKYRRLPMPIVRVALGKEFFQMFRWFNAGGYQADVEGLRRRYPELNLRTLEDWLREEGWENKRTISVKRDKMGRPLGAQG